LKTGPTQTMIGRKMIIEEKIIGTLCRYHPDPKDPKYTVSWILTDNNEIKGFMMSEIARGFGAEFAAWVQRQKKPLRVVTAVRSIASIAKRFGFVELEKKI
jgi:hypothetical protein